MRLSRVIAALTVAGLVVDCAAPVPEGRSAPAKSASVAPARIVSAGVLRVALHESGGPGGTELLNLKRAIAEELAKRMGVSVAITEFRKVSTGTAREADNIRSSAADVEAALGAKAWDVAILSTELLLGAVQQSPPILEIDVTYLVPSGSPIRSSAQVDKDGTRVVVVNGKTAEGPATLVGFLSGALKSAHLESAANHEGALEVLRSGGADALGAARHHALALSAMLPGAIVLDDRFTLGTQGMAVAFGDQEMLDAVTAFVNDARASGLIARLIERTRTRGVHVAP